MHNWIVRYDDQVEHKKDHKHRRRLTQVTPINIPKIKVPTENKQELQKSTPTHKEENKETIEDNTGLDDILPTNKPKFKNRRCTNLDPIDISNMFPKTINVKEKAVSNESTFVNQTQETQETQEADTPVIAILPTDEPNIKRKSIRFADNNEDLISPKNDSKNGNDNISFPEIGKRRSILKRKSSVGSIDWSGGEFGYNKRSSLDHSSTIRHEIDGKWFVSKKMFDSGLIGLMNSFSWLHFVTSNGELRKSIEEVLNLYNTSEQTFGYCPLSVHNNWKDAIINYMDSGVSLEKLDSIFSNILENKVYTKVLTAKDLEHYKIIAKKPSLSNFLYNAYSKNFCAIACYQTKKGDTLSWQHSFITGINNNMKFIMIVNPEKIYTEMILCDMMNPENNNISIEAVSIKRFLHNVNQNDLSDFIKHNKLEKYNLKEQFDKTLTCHDDIKIPWNGNGGLLLVCETDNKEGIKWLKTILSM